MKNIFMMGLTAITFMACGSNTIEVVEGNSVESIDIDASCTSDNKLDAYIELKTNDQIVKDDSDTSINILENSSGEKVVCINNGKAHISRAYIE